MINLVLLLIIVGCPLAAWSILRWFRREHVRYWGLDEQTGDWPAREEREWDE